MKSIINKRRLYLIVFGSDTKAGRRFDIILLWAILFSILLAFLDSVPDFNKLFRNQFYVLEWLLTIVFTIEYLLRIYISPKPLRYIFSFWGFIDLLSIVPTYFSLFFYGYHYFLVLRVFRLLRVFRILKLARFNKESIFLLNALKMSSHKITIFLSAVVTIVVLLGTIMYVVEHGENGFVSIPQSIYWAIMTLTTVGYGDIVPHTVLGKFISSFTMIIGYAIIAIPTGIITMEMTNATGFPKTCPKCDTKNHGNANFCSNCGTSIKDKVK